MNLLCSLRIMSRREPFVHLVRAYQTLRSVMQKGTSSSPQEKQGIIREFADRTGIRVFVETGTYLGDTLWASKGIFRELSSIELDRRLYEAACKRFAKYDRIHLFRGDSAEVLPQVLDSINEPCLFWLDAHDSGGMTAAYPEKTPIWKELSWILGHLVKGHVLLIDDAPSFMTDPSYPSLDKIKALCQQHYPDSTFEIRGNVIVILLKT